MGVGLVGLVNNSGVVGCGSWLCGVGGKRSDETAPFNTAPHRCVMVCRRPFLPLSCSVVSTSLCPF